jgi:hypothetical protein
MSKGAEVVERLLEPLYLAVPGSEIDRLRKQIELPMSIPYEEIPEDTFVISIGDEVHSLVFAASWDETEKLLTDGRVGALLDGRSSREVSTMVTTTHQRYYEQDYEHPAEAAELDMLCALMLRLALLEKPETKRESSRRLILMNLHYRRIDGSYKIMFTSLWKKRPGLSHG